VAAHQERWVAASKDIEADRDFRPAFLLCETVFADATN
jgi:hypothetical protein